MLAEAMKGFLASSAAIGLVRARLSFQVQVSTAFDSGLPIDSLWHVVTIILSMALFAVLPSSLPLFRKRFGFVVAASAVVTLLYGACLLHPGNLWLSVAGVAASDLFTAYAIRLWGEDNADSRIGAIVIRLGASFVVQYIVYSSMLVFSPGVRGALTALLSLAIGALLLRRPSQEARGEGVHALSGPLKRKTSVLLCVAICLSCAAHGILFCLPGSNSSVWVLGPLLVSLVVLGCSMRLRGVPLFKAVACLTLGVQCACALPLLALDFDADLVSFFRTLSYSTTMFLVMAVGCWKRAAGGADRGSALCRWLLVYFVAFYTSNYCFEALGADPVVLVALMLFFLVVSALALASAEWGLDQSFGCELDGAPDFDARRQESLTVQGALTPRESEVLSFLLRGCTAGEIAKTLQVSTNTVRSQIRSIYQKLDVHNRGELLRRALDDETKS